MPVWGERMAKTGSWRDQFPPVKHWTKYGTLSLEAEDNPGGPAVSIKLDGKWIGFQANFPAAARTVAQGAYDDKLGFSAEEAGVPTDYKLWREPMSNLDGWQGD